MVKKSDKDKKEKDNEDEGLIDELKEEAKELVLKIQKHLIAIEEHRKKDRELWRSFNRRLEDLEEVKSQRGKRRRRPKDGDPKM